MVREMSSKNSRHPPRLPSNRLPAAHVRHLTCHHLSGDHPTLAPPRAPRVVLPDVVTSTRHRMIVPEKSPSAALVRMPALLLAAMWAPACETANQAPAATAAIPALTVAVGETATVDLSAHFNDPDGDALSYGAETSDAEVALAAVTGNTASVSGVAKGMATVTVTAFDPDGLSVQQSFPVTVPNRPPVADSIPALELVEGETAVLVLSAYFSDPDGDALGYAAESSDDGVVTVAASADTVTVTGTAEGTATVTVTATDDEGLATGSGVEAGVERPVPTAVAVTPDSVLLTALGQEVALSAEVLDQIGRPMPEAPVSWESDDPAVVTVDSAGTASAAGNGAAGISATAGEVSDGARVTVMQVVRSVVVSPDTLTLVGGDTLRLDATPLDANGHRVPHKVFAWASSAASVAGVDDGGLVTAGREGTATIGATVDGVAGRARISVLHRDRAALVAFFEAAGGPGWTRRTNWLTDAPVRNWHGVLAVRDSRVSGLKLDDNGLSGSLPSELGDMVGLRELNLSDNEQLSGELPAGLASLDPLRKLLAGGTGLCAPSDSDFLAWLERIVDSRVARCEPPAAYLTQAIQSRAYPVPLVAGEEALLRVFATAARSGGDRIPGVRATFHLPGRREYVADIPEKDGNLPTEVDEGDLGISANAIIPARWIKPGLEMVIEVDPSGTMDPSLGLPERIPASGRMAVPVYEMPEFDLTLVPFLWKQAPDSAVIDSVGAMAADPGGHQLLWAAHALLPIADLAVTAHGPVEVSTNYPPHLLAATRAIQVLEGGSGYYMGTMTGRLTSRIRGAAYVSGRSSFSVLHATTMAHELGHNLSLKHAPCGGAALQDPHYPSGDGSIGAWGYDTRHGELVLPRRRDLMSYCSQRWVSDFHFAKALRYRAVREAADAARAAVRPVRSLLLWGGVDAGGRLHLEPVLAAEIPPAPPASPGAYQLTGHTRDGRELFSLRFGMPRAEDGDGSTGFAYALPVSPDWAGNLARITLSGPEGSFTLDESADRPLAILRDTRTGQVRAILRGENADFAARRGAAAVSDEASLQVLFTRGIPPIGRQ